MNHNYADDDEVAETHRQAAALIGSILTAETQHEHDLALRQVKCWFIEKPDNDDLIPHTAKLVVESLAFFVKDLLDGYDFDDGYDRLEWIAQRVDVIAEAADR